MESRPEAVVVVRTSLVTLALLAGVASGQPTDAEIIGHDESWRVDDVELRAEYLSQRGHGYQSQDGPIAGPGSEAMGVFEPYALVTVHQNDKITHEITAPVDIISAASPDAVDATTQASRRNESEDLEVRSTFKLWDHDLLTTRVGAHHEEPMSSGSIGAGWRHSLADDNATIGANANITIDGFDDHDHYGDYLGKTARETFNLNLTGSQLLSPTTVIDGGYGVTFQHGTLDTGWNAVPVAGGALSNEILPSDRVRHALSVRLAQHVPATRSTLKLWYRAYLDDFGIQAHSVELAAYQYVVPWLYVRGAYRYHHQTGADFFTTQLPMFYDNTALHTADSDLAPFSANEWSVQVAMVRGRTPGSLHDWSFGAEVLRYWRSNDLQITVVSLTVGRRM